MAFGPWQCEQYWLNSPRPSSTRSPRPSNGFVIGAAATVAVLAAAHETSARAARSAPHTRQRSSEAGRAHLSRRRCSHSDVDRSLMPSVPQFEHDEKSSFGAGSDDPLTDLAQEGGRALHSPGHD